MLLIILCITFLQQMTREINAFCADVTVWWVRHGLDRKQTMDKRVMVVRVGKL
jgi:hypothetical protein